MDSQHNPASPFISRDAAEEMAADMLGINLDRQREEQNASEISFVDEFVGTKFDSEEQPPLARAVAFNKRAMRVMFAAAEEIGDVLKDLDDPSLVSRLGLVEHELREMVPSWFGTDPSPREE